MARYELLIEYIKYLTKPELHDAVVQLAVYDCYARERKKARPAFSLKNAGEQLIRAMRKEEDSLIEYDNSNHAEYFTIDIKKTAETGTAVFRENIAIFNYSKRSPITENAEVIFYDL